MDVPHSPQSDATMVVLVDEHDRPTGVSEKLDAHRAPGLRHRALSVFVFDVDDRILLQRRAGSKYHFSGLWSNSCCTHPRPGEEITDAGERRVGEELGIGCRLREVGVFTYRAVDPLTGLVEHEVDHVLVGRCVDSPQPDPSEVSEVRALSAADLSAELVRSPSQFTPWLPDALAVLRRWIALQTQPATPDGDEVRP